RGLRSRGADYAGRCGGGCPNHKCGRKDSAGKDAPPNPPPSSPEAACPSHRCRNMDVEPQPDVCTDGSGRTTPMRKKWIASLALSLGLVATAARADDPWRNPPPGGAGAPA